MSNLNLIIGGNVELIDFYILDIISKIGYEEDKKIVYDMNVSSISDLLDEASMISLFSNGKIILGNNFNINNMSDNDMDYLARYVKNINKDVYLILTTNKIDARLKGYKIFKDNFKIIETDKVNNRDNLVEYLSKYIKDSGYRIDKYTLDYLLDKLGEDINNIKIELDKIFIYKINDKIIDREVIDLLISSNLDNIIYEFTNAIFDKDYDKISKMYHDFKIENVGFDYLIASLGNSFRQALIIKMLANRGENNLTISKVIGKKEFYVKKMLERLYNYREDDLVNFLDRLATIDRELKMGKSNLDMLELLLLKSN